MGKKIVIKPSTPTKYAKPTIKKGAKVILQKIVRKAQKPTNETVPKIKK